MSSLFVLFGRKGQKSWIKDGFSAWLRGLNAIQIHECSETHIEASVKFKMRRIAQPIIPLLEEKNKQKKQ